MRRLILVAALLAAGSSTARAEEDDPTVSVAVFVVGGGGALSSAHEATLLLTMEKALENDRRVTVIDRDRALAERAGKVPDDVISEARGLLESGEAMLRAKKAGPADAYVTGTATIDGHGVEVGFFAFEFMGGSMGSVVGEKIARQFERSLASGRPALVFTASGGARMQEGLLSLMQMAKTNASLTRLAKAKLPYVSVLTDPTMGGVSAGFAFMGDVVIAEPKALIGFAGPRVIENTVREKLPEGFQRSEFLLGKGALDMIVDRRELRMTVAQLLTKLQRQSADAVA